MQLEDRVFSDKRVQKCAAGFVCVKVDPRESRDAMKYKATRYVPEVVFLTSRLKVIARLQDRSVSGTASLMERILRRHGR